MKRMLSVLLALVMVFGAFAAVCVTASAEETEIGDLIATVSGYEIGKTTADVTVTAPEDAGYQVSVKEWLIYNHATDSYEPYTGVLENGKIYKVMITFTPKAGMYIGDEGGCWINDEWGLNWSTDGTSDYAGYEISFLQEIHTVALTGAPKPEIGKELPYDAPTIPADAMYTIEKVAWTNSNWDFLPDGMKAEDGKAYYQCFYLKAKEGWSFADDVTVTVDGKKPDEVDNDTTTMELWLYHTFRDRISSIEVTGLDEPVAGQTPDTTVTAKLDGKEAPATVYWYDENGNLVTQFAEKGIYEVEIKVQVPTGYEVPWETPFMLDGKMIAFGMSDTEVFGRKSFALGYDVLEKMEFTVDGFEEGKDSADTKVTLKDLNILETMWGVGELAYAEEFEGKFENGKKYLLAAALELPEGTFADDTTKVYLNGQLQEKVMVEYIDGMALVYVQDLELKKPATPATGDNTPVMLLTAVMVLSAAVLVALPVVYKRKEQ